LLSREPIDMKRIFLILALIPLLASGGQSIVNTGNHRKVFPSGGGCSPPATVSRWAAYNSSVLCTGSVACTDGAQGVSQPDFNAANNAVNTNGTGTTGGPVYKVSQINGLPAWQFGPLASELWFDLASGIPQTGSITFYAVIKSYSIVEPTIAAIIGVSAGHGMEWGINTNNKQFANSQGATALGTGTNALTTSTNYTLAMTYTYSTGALAFYNCSSGTCNADGTATQTASFPNPTNRLGSATDVNDPFKGYVAEWGWTNSATTAGIAAWSQCKYGI
jgi:hypothetical protein